MKIYPRIIEKHLLKEINTSQIVVLTGMRQVGKTTLIKKIFETLPTDNKVYLDLENPLNQRIFEEKNYDNILLNLKEFGINLKNKIYLFIDEIQYMPNIVTAIKYLYDHYKIKFFLTGSSSFYLKNLFSESLAGRKIIFELYPLNFEEFLIFKEKSEKFEKDFSKKAKTKNLIRYEKLKTYYEEFLNYGGFPSVVLEDDFERKKLLLADIFKSYFEKDVKVISDFKHINKLRDTILLLAGRCGSKLDITKLASEVGVSRETIYSYISFLEKTYFIHLVSPYCKNIDVEVRAAKKVYFCDTGMLNYLSKIQEGVVFENAVFNQLKKYGEINYYQRYTGSEIDFIVNKKISIEVKLTGTVEDINKLKQVSQSVGIKDYFVISKNYVDHPRIIPAVEV